MSRPMMRAHDARSERSSSEFADSDDSEILADVSEMASSSAASADGALLPPQRRRATHASAAIEHLLGPISARSVRASPPAVAQRNVRSQSVHPLPSTRMRGPSLARLPERPATAPVQLAGVLPSSADRLQRLQAHMEQLQKMYAEEVHMEEMASREALIQAVCTSGITLLRYLPSRDRFHTAVKALVSQYLPATHARLFPVGDIGGPHLLHPDDQGRQIPLRASKSAALGVAGNAVRAVIDASTSQWWELQQSRHRPGGSTNSSSSHSSSATWGQVDEASEGHLRSPWLDAFADHIVPSANSHLTWILPVRVLADPRSGYDPDIDLRMPYGKTRRRSRRVPGEAPDEHALVVVVIRDQDRPEQHPLGVLEAVMTVDRGKSGDPAAASMRLEFLEAFSGLLAAALTARSVVVRPLSDRVAIQFAIRGLDLQEVEKGGEEDDDEGEPSAPEPVTTLAIAEGVELCVYGEHAVHIEHDGPLLEAAKDAITELWTRTAAWKRRAGIHRSIATLWASTWAPFLVEMLLASTGETGAEEEDDDESRTVQAHRARLRWMLSRIALDSTSDESRVPVQVLFPGESFREFTAFSERVADDESGVGEVLGQNILSIEGQFSVLRRVASTEKPFASNENAFAAPILTPIGCRSEHKRSGEVKFAGCSDYEALEDGTDQQPNANQGAIICLVPDALQDVSDCVRSMLLPSIVAFVELFLAVEHQVRLSQVALKRIEECCVLNEQLDSAVHKLRDIQQLSSCISKCQSVSALISAINYCTLSGSTKLTLLVARYSAKESTLEEIWTVSGVDGSRQTLFDANAPSSPRRNRGMAASILELGDSLAYTSSHPAFDSTWRASPSVPSLHYLGVPIFCANAKGVGADAVLEFVFESEKCRDTFPLRDEVVAIVTSSLAACLLVEQKDEAHKQAIRDQVDFHAEQWDKWSKFLSNASSFSMHDSTEWTGQAQVAVQELIGATWRVHIYLALVGDPKYTSLLSQIYDIQEEVAATEGKHSRILHRLTGTQYSHLLAFPLRTDDNDCSEDHGLLVFGAVGDKSLVIDDQCVRRYAVAVALIYGAQIRVLGEHNRRDQELTSQDARHEQILEAFHALERAACNLNRQWRYQRVIAKLRCKSLSGYGEGNDPTKSFHQLIEYASDYWNESLDLASSNVELAIDKERNFSVCILMSDARSSSRQVTCLSSHGGTFVVEAVSTSLIAPGVYRYPFQALPVDVASSLGLHTELVAVVAPPRCLGTVDFVVVLSLDKRPPESASEEEAVVFADSIASSFLASLIDSDYREQSAVNRKFADLKVRELGRMREENAFRRKMLTQLSALSGSDCGVAQRNDLQHAIITGIENCVRCAVGGEVNVNIRSLKVGVAVDEFESVDESSTARRQPSPRSSSRASSAWSDWEREEPIPQLVIEVSTQADHHPDIGQILRVRWRPVGSEFSQLHCSIHWSPEGEYCTDQAALEMKDLVVGIVCDVAVVLQMMLRIDELVKHGDAQGRELETMKQSVTEHERTRDELSRNTAFQLELQSTVSQILKMGLFAPNCSSLCSIVSMVQGCRLWIAFTHEDGTVKLWNEVGGVKQIINYETGRRGFSEVVVEGVCVAVLETPEDDDLDTSSTANFRAARLLHAALTSFFVILQRDTQLHQKEQERQATIAEETQKRLEHAMRQELSAMHIQQTVSMLSSLRPDEGHDLEGEEDSGMCWSMISSALSQVERGIQASWPDEIVAIHAHFVGVNLSTRAITYTCTPRHGFVLTTETSKSNVSSSSLKWSDLSEILAVIDANGDLQSKTSVTISRQIAASAGLQPDVRWLQPDRSLGVDAQHQLVIAASWCNAYELDDSNASPRAVAIIQAIIKHPSETDKVDRALQVHGGLLIAAYERLRLIASSRCSRRKTATELDALQELNTNIQQWGYYAQTMLANAHALVKKTVAFVESPPSASRASVLPHEVIGPELDSFAQLCCACDSVAVFVSTIQLEQEVVEITSQSTISLQSEPGESPPLVALTADAYQAGLDTRRSHLEWLSQHAYSTESVPMSNWRSTTWRRIVFPSSFGSTSRFPIGSIECRWNDSKSQPAQDSDVLESMAAWISLVVSIIYRHSHSQLWNTQLHRRIEELSDTNNRLELEGIAHKQLMTSHERCRVDLEQAFKRATEALRVLRAFQHELDTTACISDPRIIWNRLVDHASKLPGVDGIQVWNRVDDEGLPSLVQSTLSDSADERMKTQSHFLDAIRRAHPGWQVHTTIDPPVAVLRLSQLSPAVLVLITAADQLCSDPSFSMECAEIMTKISTIHLANITHKADAEAECKRMNEIISTLEVRCEETNRELTVVRQRCTRRDALILDSTLPSELMGHQLWTTIDQSNRIRSMKMTKVVGMWNHLQSITRARLQQAFKWIHRLQIFGVIDDGDDRHRFLFSPARDARNQGFDCIPVDELRNRDESRQLAQCVLTRSVSRTPSTNRQCQICVPIVIPHRDLRSIEVNDETNFPPIVVGVLSVKQARNDDSSELDFIDDSIIEDISYFLTWLAPRIESIGMLVRNRTSSCRNDEQQRTGFHRPHALQPSTSIEESPETVAGRRPNYEARDVAKSSSNSNTDVCTVFLHNSYELKTGSASAHPNNQDVDEETDSEDERQRELHLQRVRVAVASGVISFVLKLQDIGVDVTTLSNDRQYQGWLNARAYVAQAMKHVWTKHGDARKKQIETCELLIVTESHGICDQWPCEESIHRYRGRHKGWIHDLEGHIPKNGQESLLVKISSSRWALVIVSPTDHVLILAITGFHLDSTFDSHDENAFIPQLGSAIGQFFARLIQECSRVSSTQALLSSMDAQHNSKLVALHAESSRIKAEANRETLLHAITVDLLRASSERSIVHIIIDRVRECIPCKNVTFENSNIEIDHNESVDQSLSKKELSASMVVENVLRIRIAAPIDSNPDSSDPGGCTSQVLGIVVVTLNNQQSEISAHLNAALLDWLKRVASIAGVALQRLRMKQDYIKHRKVHAGLAEDFDLLRNQLNVANAKNANLLCRIQDLDQALADQGRLSDCQTKLQEAMELEQAKVGELESVNESLRSAVKRYESQLIEANCQLEEAIRVEAQFARLRAEHSRLEHKAQKLEKKVLKQRYMLHQQKQELEMCRHQGERDRNELEDLRRQVAQMTEQNARLEATSAVSSAATQAQLQMQLQFQQHQLANSTPPPPPPSTVPSGPTATETLRLERIQRRWLRQLRLQQQVQKRKQLDLAQELRQLASMEVHEMQRRGVEQREREVTVQVARLNGQLQKKQDQQRGPVAVLQSEPGIGQTRHPPSPTKVHSMPADGKPLRPSLLQSPTVRPKTGAAPDTLG